MSLGLVRLLKIFINKNKVTMFHQQHRFKSNFRYFGSVINVITIMTLERF